MNNYTTLIDALIKAEGDGNPQHEKIVHVCDTPEYLINHASFSAIPLVITGKVIGKAYFDHGISALMLKRMPEILGNPQCVFKSASHPTESVIVLTFEIKGTYPVIIPIRRNYPVGRSRVVNVITSVYGKEGPDPATKWQKDGLLIWKP